MDERIDNMTAPHRRSRRTIRAFTIIELLLVVAIIIILLSIVIVAINFAMRTAQSTNTQALMSAVNKGLVQFRNDIGYLPPVLGTEPSAVDEPYIPSRDYAPFPLSMDMPAVEGEGNFNDYREAMQNWYSITTLAEYLLGYGDAFDDGYGANNPISEDGPLGIRHPGTDGYWSVGSRVPDCLSGGEAGTYDTRRDFLGGVPACLPHSDRFRRGRSYGPYLELRDDRLLAAVIVSPTGTSWQIVFPGEANYDDEAPKTIVDYWGQPIRFYRKPYLPGRPDRDFRVVPGGDIQRTPTMSDVFVLRPYRVREGEAVDGIADERGDTTTSLSLQTAQFALLSAGPDRRVEQGVRADADVQAAQFNNEYNRDNIVELGR